MGQGAGRGQRVRETRLAETDPFVVRPLADHEIERVLTVLGVSRLYQGDGFYLVAWEHDEPLGHAHLALTDPSELQDVSVRPEYRRRGVASALTAAAELVARARGFDRMLVGVSDENKPAQALYRQCGYVEVGVPPNRVQGTIVIRSGPIEVDDTILTWEKRLDARA
jgi:ribosomal protein S18 acetylase RimI-like enzyme